jgi:thymidylate synthase
MQQTSETKQVYSEEAENYLKPIQDLMTTGEIRGDRTGVGTRSKFGHLTRYNLRNCQFPLFTAKRVPWPSLYYELDWFLKGETNEKKLSEKGSKIWKANSDAWHAKKVAEEKLMEDELKEITNVSLGYDDLEDDYKELAEEAWSSFRDPALKESEETKEKRKEKNQRRKRVQYLTEKLSRRHIDGDLGPIYGWQWLHFGAKYIDCNTDYTGQGFNQIEYVINEIKNNPNSRQIFLSAWNPADLHLMALPPCHVSYQFRVSNGELSCMMLQRSVDTILGQPFNIASASLLTCMIAHVCGLVPGELIHSLGDYHVYRNHEEGVKELLSRTPSPKPTLKINRPASEIKSLSDFRFEDFEISGYKPAPAIKFQMAV